MNKNRWVILLAATLIISACGPAATAIPPSPAPTSVPTEVPTLAPTAVPAATATEAAPPTTAPTAVPVAASATPDAGVLATSVALGNPAGIAVDADGKLYVSDCWFVDEPAIYTIDSAGMLEHFAGSGYSFGGDGGPALAAQFWCVTALAFDSNGNLYLVDQHNNRIRRIDAEGTINTVAGSGPATTINDQGPAKGGFAGDGGPASEARLNTPIAIAFDAQDNLYILDRDNNRVRKVDAAGNITTIAGEGTWGFSGDGGPATAAMISTSSGIAVDAAGNVYIADTDNARIRMVDVNGMISTFAGTGEPGYAGDGGPAAAAQLSSPAGMAFDADGNLYFVDGQSQSVDIGHVRKISPDGTITTITSVRRGGGFVEPVDGGLAFDSAGNLYVIDAGKLVVRKVDQAGNVTTVAGTES
jgi:sugar lactone lactonase YvrE